MAYGIMAWDKAGNEIIQKTNPCNALFRADIYYPPDGTVLEIPIPNIGYDKDKVVILSGTFKPEPDYVQRWPEAQITTSLYKFEFLPNSIKLYFRKYNWNPFISPYPRFFHQINVFKVR